MSRSSTIVVDANVAVHIVLATPVSDLADRAWTAWQRHRVEAYAPRLWLYEVTSAIHKVFMLGEICEEKALAALDTILSLGMHLVGDDDLSHQAFAWATRMRRLAAYDCFYLALAEQMSAEFWTADRALASTAAEAGAPWVRWIGEA